MEISKIKKALIEQKRINLSGNLYYKTQIDFTYNTNHIEGSTITPDETASIYDSGTILTSNDKVIVLKDATETKNHFTLFKYMLDMIDEPLTEEIIKKYHFILKDGTLTEDENFVCDHGGAIDIDIKGNKKSYKWRVSNDHNGYGAHSVDMMHDGEYIWSEWL